MLFLSLSSPSPPPTASPLIISLFGHFLTKEESKDDFSFLKVIHFQSLFARLNELMDLEVSKRFLDSIPPLFIQEKLPIWGADVVRLFFFSRLSFRSLSSLSFHCFHSPHSLIRIPLRVFAIDTPSSLLSPSSIDMISNSSLSNPKISHSFTFVRRSLFLRR